MDFFMKPLREYMIKRMVLSTNIMNLIKPIAFIGGNMIWRHILKRIHPYNKVIIPPIDITKEYNSKHTKEFLKTYKQSNNDMNSNIDEVFYSKDDYTKTMRDINNELERKWKQKVIHDWKSDKLRYEHSKSILCSWKFDRVAPIDEKVFF